MLRFQLKLLFPAVFSALLYIISGCGTPDIPPEDARKFLEKTASEDLEYIVEEASDSLAALYRNKVEQKIAEFLKKEVTRALKYGLSEPVSGTWNTFFSVRDSVFRYFYSLSDSLSEERFPEGDPAYPFLLRKLGDASENDKGISISSDIKKSMPEFINAADLSAAEYMKQKATFLKSRPVYSIVFLKWFPLREDSADAPVYDRREFTYNAAVDFYYFRNIDVKQRRKYRLHGRSGKWQRYKKEYINYDSARENIVHELKSRSRLAVDSIIADLKKKSAGPFHWDISRFEPEYDSVYMYAADIYIRNKKEIVRDFSFYYNSKKGQWVLFAKPDKEVLRKKLIKKLKLETMQSNNKFDIINIDMKKGPGLIYARALVSLFLGNNGPEKYYDFIYRSGYDRWHIVR
ncbi:MAG: hypothetical protein ACLFQK_09730 [Fibrobacterota bacterium]